MALILGYFFISAETGLFIDWRPNAPVSCFATTKGKTIYVDQGRGMEPFEIRGVNMGVGIPGHFATDYAIDKATYLRWFQQIQDMGANCVRVYTLLSDDFYNAVYEFNHNNDNPLYILHGVWINDYIHYSRRDAYDPAFFDEFLRDCRMVVDVLHGKYPFLLNEDLGSGSYNKDISPWVLGYILGVEWEDTTVAYTDHMWPARNSYTGKYVRATEEASPFEALLAQVADRLIAYETTRYKAQRLVAFTNWPTTDPLDWPDTVSFYFRKFAKVDVEHFETTGAFLSGHFASYHLYPYYPDYLGFMDVVGEPVPTKAAFTEHGVFNSYRAYLHMINEYHTVPVVVAEYGVPSSRGRAQSDRNTNRHQGGLSDHEQALAITACYRDIMDAGLAGSILFTWQDEWFKRTWNTMAFTDLTRTPYWCDVQTNEQHFGILAFDPGKERSVCYVDGDLSEWENVAPIVETDGLSLSYLYDEAYLYLRVHKENYRHGQDVLYIPLDITPKTGSKAADGCPLPFERPADFLVVLDGEDNSQVLVQQRYEALRAIFSHRAYGEDAYLNPPAPDTANFVPIKLILQVPLDPRTELAQKVIEIADTFETGLLRQGNGNPASPDFNSLADFYVNGDDIELRLPWLLLNFADPSRMIIHDDYYAHYGVEYIAIDSIWAGVGSEGAGQGPVAMGEAPLSGWGRRPAYHERLREGYYAMQALWAAD